MTTSDGISIQIHPPILAIRLFTPICRALVLVLAALALTIEAISVPAGRSFGIYSYFACQALLVFVIGYGLPLSLSSFDKLNRGLLLTVLAILIGEALKWFIHFGNGFHWYEVVFKELLLLLGFSVALNARFDREVSWGRIRIRLEV